MTRSAEPYAEMRRPAVRFTGSDVSQPVAGFYRYRLHGGAVRGGGRLRGGSTKSCGCFRRDRAGNLFRSHGKSKTIEYCMFYDARKRAIAFGLPFSIEPEDIKVPAFCPVLGIELLKKGNRDNRPSLDRIIPSKGYVCSNIRVISFRANRIKSDASADDLRAVLNYVEAATCDT